MPTVTLLFGEWMPDQPAFNSPGAATVTNVVPLTAGSYGPVPGVSAYSNALGARCIGSFTTSDSNHNRFVFAGTQTALYLLQAGSTNFGDVSGVVYAGSPWPDTLWSFTSYGTRVIATNYANNIQTFIPGVSGAFSDLAAAAPRAKYVDAVADFLMVGNTFDGVGGVQTQRVWWSGIGDPTNWPTPGSSTAISVQSDYQDLQQTDLGQITGLKAGPLPAATATIFCEYGVWRANYVGSPTIFQFTAVEGAPGTRAPMSIVRRRTATGAAVLYYLGTDGFYSFDGASAFPIGAGKVDKYVLNALTSTTVTNVVATCDPIKKLIYWAYSSTASATFDKIVCYNWELNRWSLIDVSDTPIEWITTTATVGYTLDGLDALGFTIDTLPYSLDSPAWAGGSDTLAVFTNAHRLAYQSGANRAPTIETTEAELVPGRRTRLRNARPLVDATGGSISVAVRERLADSATYKTAVTMNAMGECPQRYTGRYIRGRFTFPASTNFTHLQGIEFDILPEGIR